jgi:hypothetical protein
MDAFERSGNTFGLRSRCDFLEEGKEKMKSTKHPVGVTCRHCGTSGLEWRKQKNGRWRLYVPESRFPHVCREYVPDEEEDEDDDE